MLKSIRIQRFRSCRDVTVSKLAGVTLLIGANGAGKTNFLRGLQWAARTAIRGASPKDWAAFNSNASVDLEFSARGLEFKYSVSAKLAVVPSVDADGVESNANRLMVDDALHVKNGTDWMPLVVRVGTNIETWGYEPSTCPPEQGALTHAFLGSKPGKQEIKEWDMPIYFAWTFLNRISYYPLEMPQGEPSYFTGVDLKKWETEGSHRPGNDDLKKLTKLQREKKDLFEELKSLLGPDTLGILSEIDVQVLTPPQAKGQEAPESSTMYFPGFTPSNFHEGKLVPYEDLSFGTRRLFSLVLAMIADEASVMLIEQPEDGIHPGLLKKLLAVLKGYADPQQFIITSHSPAVVNVLTPHDIRLVEMTDAVTTIRPLSDEELDQAHAYVASEGALYDFIKALES